MLIRRPVAEVFAAFTEPAQLAKFWLARASGRLAPGATVRWEFIVRGAVTDVRVQAFEANRRIGFVWGEGDTVELRFTERADGTFVRIENTGFTGDDDEVVAKAVDSTGGFTLVLCELKALLERGISMSYGPDKLCDAELVVERR
jgi:uncharacterized protein YndB with AHSA1/START domain